MMDYTNIDRPYDSLLNREMVTSTPVEGSTSSGNGSVEEQSVKSSGALGDVWIKSFIRSQNWQPKTQGFTIDGQTGYAEFTNVFVSGEIEASIGTIGGWTIGAAELSSGGIHLKSTAEQILLGLATAPLTGDGLFIGKDGADYEFRAGDPAGAYMHWDGTNIAIRTAATGAARVVIDSSDNTITFYNASNAVVAQMGGGASVGNAVRVTLDASTTTGMSVSTTIDGSVGLNVQSSSNVTVTPVNISLTSTGTGNDAAAIRITHSGGSSSSRGIHISKSTVGNGILVENSGTSDSVAITTTSNAARSFSVINATSGGSADLVYLENAAGGSALSILNTSNANAVTISNTPSSNAASLFIDHNFAYGAIELDVDGANASETYGILADVRNSSSGVVAAISINTGGAGSGAYYALDVGGSGKFYESSAVGGTQDRKIRVRIGGTLYYIPCHTA